MRRIWLAIRVFVAVLFQRHVAEAVAAVLGEPKPPELAPVQEAGKSPPKPATPPKPSSPPKAVGHSDAIALLSTLQREARFLDFIQEPLGGYSDAQIGAAARDVHRDCAAVIGRIFALVPVVQQDEGSEVEVPAGFDSGRFRLTGNVAGEPPFRGRLAHHGWEATRCELPAWTGKESSARVIAPAEVELR